MIRKKAVFLIGTAIVVLAGALAWSLRLFTMTNCLMTLKTDGIATCVAYSPSGRLIAAGTFDGELSIWDSQRGRRVTSFRTGIIDSVVFITESLVATGALPGGLEVWDIAAGSKVCGIEENNALGSFRCSPDGRTLTYGLGDPIGEVRQWDRESGEITTLFRHAESSLAGSGMRMEVAGLACSPDGRTMVIAVDCGVLLWDVLERKELAVLIGGDRAPRGVAFSKDGRTVAVTEGATKLFDVATGALAATIDAPPGDEYGGCASIAFSNNGSLIAIGLGTGIHQTSHVLIVSATTHQVLSLFPAHDEPFLGLAWAPDDKSLATASHDRTVRVWKIPDTITGKQVE